MQKRRERPGCRAFQPKTKGEPGHDESKINILGAQRADITAWRIADAICQGPFCQGTVLPATHFCANIELNKAVIRWMSHELGWK